MDELSWFWVRYWRYEAQISPELALSGPWTVCKTTKSYHNSMQHDTPLNFVPNVEMLWVTGSYSRSGIHDAMLKCHQNELNHGTFYHRALVRWPCGPLFAHWGTRIFRRTMLPLPPPTFVELRSDASLSISIQTMVILWHLCSCPYVLCTFHVNTFPPSHCTKKWSFFQNFNIFLLDTFYRALFKPCPWKVAPSAPLS